MLLEMFSAFLFILQGTVLIINTSIEKKNYSTLYIAQVVINYDHEITHIPERCVFSTVTIKMSLLLIAKIAS